MIKTQDRISKLVPGFKFNLGFSGKYFHRGTWEENEGDDTLLGNKVFFFFFNNIKFSSFIHYCPFVLTENVDKFNWFCHMWNHMQPHLYNNETHLEYEMTLNKAFAEVSFAWRQFM